MRITTLPTLAVAFALAAPMAPALAQTASPLSSIFNCAASGNKQETGALIGAAAGALLGTQVAKNEQTLAGVLGAGLGAAAGSWVGCRMQTTDQTRAQTAIQTALTSGRSQTWTDAQTGASGRVDLYPAYETANQPTVRQVAYRDLRYADGVNTAGSEYAIAPGLYTVNSVANLRANPGQRANVVGRVAAGEVFNVVGNVNSGDWLLVERNGVVVGYVSADLARPAPAQSNRQPAQQISSNCQEVSHVLSTTQYGQQTERYRACRDNSVSGGWAMTRLS
ncbi:MAG: cell surface protein [Caulobacteraceae bacterium]|nr:cell surface protein [Caulobacteraceae bacterium]